MEPLELTKAQTEILTDEHRFRVIVCGRKFGKTTVASEEISACAFAKTNKRVIYIAPTLDDARRLMWERLKRRFGNVVEKSNDTRLELVIPTQDMGVSTIFLGSWEKVDNYRGDEFDLIIFDEVQDYHNFWMGWQESMRPTLTPRQGAALFMGTPKGFNHLYDLYSLEHTEKDFKSFHFTSYDNPHIPVQEIEDAKRQLTEDRFAQEYLADFRKTEGLVYKEFDRKLHVSADKFYPVKTFGGVDFGFTHPAAAITIQKDKDANYHIPVEWYKTQQTDEAIAEYVASLKWSACYPDPENAGAIKQLKNHGVNVREVLKGKGSIKSGVNIVRELFKANRLTIDPSCKNLIWELETYSYKDKDGATYEDENPVKENDDALDALRYALMMESSSNSSPAKVFKPSWKSYNKVR